jgi:hypothetical protein
MSAHAFTPTFQTKVIDYSKKRSGFLSLDIERVNRAESFTEFYSIALDVRDRLFDLAKREGKKLMFISSPMTSGNDLSIEENSKRIMAACQYHETHGFIVFCQLVFTDPINRLWRLKLEQSMTNDEIYHELMSGFYVPFLEESPEEGDNNTPCIERMAKLPGCDISKGGIAEGEACAKRNSTKGKKKIVVQVIAPDSTEFEIIKSKALLL